MSVIVEVDAMRRVEDDAGHHAQVGDAGDDEGLDRRLRGLAAVRTAQGDHPVQREQQAFPKHEEENEVVREHGAVYEGERD